MSSHLIHLWLFIKFAKQVDTTESECKVSTSPERVQGLGARTIYHGLTLLKSGLAKPKIAINVQQKKLSFPAKNLSFSCLGTSQQTAQLNSVHSVRVFFH